MVLVTAGGGGSSAEEAAKEDFKETIGSGAGGVGQVYMGPGPIRHEGMGPLPSADVMVPLNQAYAYFDGFSRKQLRDFISTGRVAGQLQDDAGPLEAFTLWKKLVDRSAAYTAAGRKIAPQDVLSMYISGQDDASGDGLWRTQYRSGRKFLVNAQTGEVKYQGPRFETVSQRSIDLSDPATAKAIASSVFQQLMHRDPGKGEMQSFADALRSAEEASPTITETTTEYDMATGEPIGTSSTTSGGMPPDAKVFLAEQRIKGSKEYGAVQAATTYEGALMDAVFGSPFGSL